MATAQDVRIEYLPLDLVLTLVDPANPKAHDQDGIRASIGRFGFNAPLVRNELTGRLLAGAGRAEALAAARGRGEQPPERIRVDQEGNWLVPVVHGISLPEEEARRFLVVENQLVMRGGWNDQALAELVQSFQQDGLGLDGIGFDGADLDRLLADVPVLPEVSVESDEDEFDLPTPDEPTVRTGDVYRLGDHRLVVGDASVPGNIERALGGEPAALLFTDPPYGVTYVGKTTERLRISGDDLSPAATAQLIRTVLELARVSLAPGASFYVCGPAGDMEPVVREAAGVLGTVRQSIVWVKDQFVLGRADYHWRHELVHYGWIAGRRHRWLGGRSEDSVWEIPRPRRSAEHPTMKPTALVRRALRNSSRAGDLVLDPFAGSGTTLLAAHQMRRRAAVVELDPRYAQVTIARWERLSGRTAEQEA